MKLSKKEKKLWMRIYVQISSMKDLIYRLEGMWCDLNYLIDQALSGRSPQRRSSRVIKLKSSKRSRRILKAISQFESHPSMTRHGD